MRGVPCGICPPHREHFAEMGILFSSYLVCRFGVSDINLDCSPPSTSMPFHYAAAISEVCSLLLKRVRNSTGLFCLGVNGTVVSLPHLVHVTCVSVRRNLLPLLNS